jgi:hypothetical protein
MVATILGAIALALAIAALIVAGALFLRARRGGAS